MARDKEEELAGMICRKRALSPSGVRAQIVSQWHERSEDHHDKIEAIIRPSKLDDVKAALEFAWNHRDHCVPRNGQRQTGVAAPRTTGGQGIIVNLLDKVKIETVVMDDRVDEVMECYRRCRRHGQIGDGKIFVYKVGQRDAHPHPRVGEITVNVSGDSCPADRLTPCTSGMGRVALRSHPSRRFPPQRRRPFRDPAPLSKSTGHTSNLGQQMFPGAFRSVKQLLPKNCVCPVDFESGAGVSEWPDAAEEESPRRVRSQATLPMPDVQGVSLVRRTLSPLT